MPMWHKNGAAGSPESIVCAVGAPQAWLVHTPTHTDSLNCHMCCLCHHSPPNPQAPGVLSTLACLQRALALQEQQAASHQVGSCKKLSPTAASHQVGGCRKLSPTAACLQQQQQHPCQQQLVVLTTLLPVAMMTWTASPLTCAQHQVGFYVALGASYNE